MSLCCELCEVTMRRGVAQLQDNQHMVPRQVGDKMGCRT